MAQAKRTHSGALNSGRDEAEAEAEVASELSSLLSRSREQVIIYD